MNPLKTIEINIPECPTDTTSAMFTDGNIALIAFIAGVLILAAIITTGMVMYRKYDK